MTEGETSGWFKGTNTSVPDPTLITDVQEYIERYVSLLPAQSLVEAVWALHTYLIGVFEVTPYLYVSSKGPGSGKTRNMDVLATLVRNPGSGTDSPVHVLGQEIAASQPTLFFDEVDTVFGGRCQQSAEAISQHRLYEPML